MGDGPRAPFAPSLKPTMFALIDPSATLIGYAAVDPSPIHLSVDAAHGQLDT